MADTAQVSRTLLDAIGAFRDAYKGDSKFDDVLTSLNKTEESVEQLVPGVKDKTPDAADKADNSPPDKSDGGNDGEAKDMQSATRRARGYFTAKK